MENNVVGWFEIPVKNMDRAILFYEKLLNIKFDRHKLGPLEMAWFPWLENKPGSPGALVFNTDYYKPSAEGVMIYLTAHSGDLNNELAKVEAVGGKVLQQKTEISAEYGFMALIMDSEGNRVALHSRK